MVWLPCPRARTGALVVVACALAAGVAHAEEPLEKARQALDDLDYAAAQSALAEALASGSNGPTELVEIYKLTGTVAASLGDTKAATAAFEKLLALSPSANLPPGTSPKIAKPFAAATDHAKQRGALRVKAETATEPPSVTLVIESDPLDMVVGASVVAVVDRAPEKMLTGEGKGKITIALPRGRRIDLQLRALDSHGNRLVELGTKEVPIVITGAEPKPAPTGEPAVQITKREPRAQRPFYLRWWLWGGAALALGGGTAYVGLQARSDADRLQLLFDASSSHSAGESTALETRTRRELYLMNAGIGITAFVAVGAVYLYLTRPSRESASAVAIAPVVLAGGGGLAVGGGF